MHVASVQNPALNQGSVNACSVPDQISRAHMQTINVYGCSKGVGWGSSGSLREDTRVIRSLRVCIWTFGGRAGCTF